MEIAGLPAHPLIIHATVVLTPLAAIITVVFAVWPRHRWLTRWPAVVAALVAVVSVWAARLSGDSMVEANRSLAQLVATHQERGELLSLVVVAFAVLTLLATWVLGGPSALASGAGERATRTGVLAKVMPAVLVVAAVALLVSVAMTGDAGARAVWG